MKRADTEQPEKTRVGVEDFLWLSSMLLLPVIAIALVTYNVTVVSTPDIMSKWVAIPVGVVIGTLLLGGLIANSGNDAMDVIVNSVIVIVLMLFLMPLAPKAKAERHRRLRQAAPVKPSTGGLPNAPAAQVTGTASGSTPSKPARAPSTLTPGGVRAQ